MAMTEQPKRPGFGEFIYDKLFHNYIWSSIFRSVSVSAEWQTCRCLMPSS